MRIFTLRNITIGFLAFFVILLMAPVWADAECVGHSCNDGADFTDGDVYVDTNVDSPVSVETTVNPSSSMTNKSRSFGFGLGDVDIAQCYRSYSVIIWQDSRINAVCLADSLDAKGLHDVAAMVRCDIRAIRKHFDSDTACVAANTMVPAPVEVMAEPEDTDDEDYRVEVQQTIDALQQKVIDLESRPAQTRTVERVIDPELQRRLDEDARRRAATRAILEKAE